MKDNIRIAQSELETVAASLEKRGYGYSVELRKIAQELGGMSPSDASGGEMDPAMLQSMLGAGGPDGTGSGSPDLGGANMSVDSGMQNVQPMSDVAGGKAHIESFVHPAEPGAPTQVDDRDSHSATINFKTPKDVTQLDIMRLMLEMGKQIDVDIDGFKWQKQTAKG